jgi:predicted Zn finger-like uncharacterized protein
MIVKCEQCQTRFKVPDDKVTEKGVKVRCTKCQHTFRVKKEPDPAAPTTPGAAPADPFAKFGPAVPAADTEETRRGVYALGVQASKASKVNSKTHELGPLSPSFAAQSDLPAEAFDAPTRVTAPPAPPPGRKPLSDPAPFDFSALSAPPAPNPAPPKAARGIDPQPFDFSSLGPPPEPAPGSSDVTRRAPVPGPPAKASKFEPQPFDFSALPPAPEVPKSEQTRRERPPQAPARPSTFEPQPFDFSALDQAPPSPAAPVGHRAAPATPSSFEPESLDFSSLDAPPPAPGSSDVTQRAPMPRPKASAPAPRPVPPTSAPKPPPRPPPMPPPPSQRFDTGPPMDLGPPPPPPKPRPSPTAVTQIDTRTVDAPERGGLLGDIPPATGSLSIDVDDGLEASPEQRGSLFDMPAAPEPMENQLQPPEPREQVAVARIALKKVSSEQLAKPEQGQQSSRRPKRSMVSVVWNAVSGLVLAGLLAVLVMVVLNEGKVDASLSWSKLKGVFSKPRELVAFDISNGLYETRAGRSVFYVRGEVKNRGPRAGRVRVKAEILDGEELVRAAEGFAGATPSPEDLYSVATAEDLVRLSTRLLPSAATLESGSQSSFLVAFYEYPPDLKDFRVRVTVMRDDGTTAAR